MQIQNEQSLKSTYYNRGKCPYCENSDIESGMPQVKGDVVIADAKCNSCKSHWKEIYDVIDIILD